MAEPTKINDRSALSDRSLADLAEFKKAGYATIINNRPDNEEPGQLDHVTAEAEAKKQGLDYRYQPIVSLGDFAARRRSSSSICCRARASRSSLIAAAARAAICSTR